MLEDEITPHLFSLIDALNELLVQITIIIAIAAPVLTLLDSILG